MNTTKQQPAYTFHIHGAPSGRSYYLAGTAAELDALSAAPVLRPEFPLPDHVAPEDAGHFRAALSTACFVRPWEEFLQLMEGQQAAGGAPFSMDATYPNETALQALADHVEQHHPSPNERARRCVVASIREGVTGTYLDADLCPADLAEDFASIMLGGNAFYAAIWTEQDAGPMLGQQLGVDRLSPTTPAGSMAEAHHLGHRIQGALRVALQYLALRTRGHSADALTSTMGAELRKQLEADPIKPFVAPAGSATVG